MNFQFPTAQAVKIIMTGQMKEVIHNTLAVHQSGACVVWTGISGLGKTTTARKLVELASQNYDPENPNAFRIVHYEVGEITQWAGQKGKKAIRSLYNAASGPMDEGTYRQAPVEALAAQLVRVLKRKNIRMIIVDEAGLLTLDAIRGMILVLDTAENLGYPLTLVFVGMDDLPTKLTKIPQIERRVHEWCYFGEYNLEETWDLLAELHPHFSTLDKNKKDHIEQVEFIHKKFGGKLGLIVPFLRRLDYAAPRMKVAIDLTLLKAIHMQTHQSRKQAIDAQHHGYGKKARRKEEVTA